MKAYLLQVVIIDHDRIGGDAIREELENARYGNDCISPRVAAVREADIGEWSDDHPLNQGGANLLEPFKEPDAR